MSYLNNRRMLGIVENTQLVEKTLVIAQTINNTFSLGLTDDEMKKHINRIIDTAASYLNKFRISEVAKYAFNIAKTLFNHFYKEYPKQYNKLTFLFATKIALKFLAIYSYYEMREIHGESSLRNKGYANSFDTNLIGDLLLDSSFAGKGSAYVLEPVAYFRHLATMSLYIANIDKSNDFIIWFNKKLSEQNQDQMNKIYEYIKDKSNGHKLAMLDFLLGSLSSLYLFENGLTPGQINIPTNSIIYDLLLPEDINVKEVVISNQDELNKLTNQLAQWKIKFDKLELENSQNKVKISELTNERTNLNTELDKYRRGDFVPRTDLTTTQNDLRNAKDLLSSKQMELDNAKDDINRLTDEANSLKDRAKSYDEQISDYESKINNMIDEINKYKSQIKELEKQIAEYKANANQVPQLLSQIQQLQNEKQELLNKIDMLNVKINEYENTLKKLYDNFNAIKNQLTNKLSDLNAINSKLKNTGGKVTKTKEVIALIDTLKDKWKNVLDKTIQNEDALNTSLKELENTINDEWSDKIISKLRGDVDGAIKLAIRDSKALHEFIIRMTDIITQQLLTKKGSLLGNSYNNKTIKISEDLSAQISAINNQIGEVILNANKLIEDYENIDVETPYNKILDLNTFVDDKFDKITQSRRDIINKIENLKKLISQKVVQIMANYPDNNYIVDSIMTNINKLVYYFMKKALLSYETIKNKMFRY